MDWTTVNQVLDDVAVTLGVAVLIVRQFQWRSADLHRMLRLPLIIVAVGLVLAATELGTGFAWMPGDWIIVGEFALVAVTGTIMGAVTRFRRRADQLQYRLTTAGLWLWVLFIAIRIGSFALAAALGARLADATGIILLSFGLNRLAAVAVVRRRVLGRTVTVGDAYPGNPCLRWPSRWPLRPGGRLRRRGGTGTWV